MADWRNLISRKDPGFSRKLSSGVNIRINSRIEWMLYNDIFVERDYDQGILDLLAQEQNSLQVVDLGSNVGFFFLRIADLMNKCGQVKSIQIYAVDGSLSLCNEASERLQQSSVPQGFRVKIINGLIGPREGTGVLHELKDHALNSVFGKTGTIREVNYIDLAVQFCDIAEIHLLKCDIEGSEHIFIENYPDLLRKTKAALFEFHLDRIDYEDCVRLLSSYGLTHRKVVQRYPGTVIEYFWK